MKVDAEHRTVELTERNLRTLLAKLAGHPPESFCTLEKDGWAVKAVPDEEHYGWRPAGEVHPATAEFLGQVET